jgi:hypothetical protein
VTEPVIKPRIDKDGVGWCDEGCPEFHWANTGETVMLCSVSDDVHYIDNERVCPHHAKRMAALLRRVLWILGKVSAIRGVESGRIGTFMAEIISEIRALLGGK